jgi:hypothetical protein
MMRWTWTWSSSEPNLATLPDGFNLVIKSLATKPVVGENDEPPRGNGTNGRENEDPLTSRLKDREQDWESAAVGFCRRRINYFGFTHLQ